MNNQLTARPSLARELDDAIGAIRQHIVERYQSALGRALLGDMQSIAELDLLVSPYLDGHRFDDVSTAYECLRSFCSAMIESPEVFFSSPASEANGDTQRSNGTLADGPRNLAATGAPALDEALRAD